MDTPLRGIYIPHFDKISVKISVWGSYTLIVAPMGVKFGTEDGTVTFLVNDVIDFDKSCFIPLDFHATWN